MRGTKLRKHLLLLLAIFPSAALAVDNPEAVAVKFGAREQVETIALSPDGTKILYAIPWEGQGSRVYSVEIGSTRPQLITAANGRDVRLGGCNWVSNARTVCQTFNMIKGPHTLVAGSRLVAFDSDGGNMRILGERESTYQTAARLWGGSVVDWLPGDDDHVLMQQSFIPEGRAGTLLARKDEGVGVVRVNTATLATRPVERPEVNAIRFVSDGRGQVRVMSTQSVRGSTGMDGSQITHFFRRAGSSQWERLGVYDSSTNEGPWPLAVDTERDAVYIMEQIDGREQIYRMALDGSGRRDLTVRHDHVDMDSLMRIGRSARVVGASYATERREVVYFDPELKQIAAQLSRALPDTPLIDFLGASDDERKLLIRAGSDTDPGTYYVLDRDTMNLVRIMRSRPELEGIALAEMKPVTYAAADGTQIPAYLTLPPGGDRRGLPAIVMPHGGPGARDEWGFDWLAQFFANRGFAVLQPNFRGSAGYGREWFQENGFRSWPIAIGDVNDAGRWLVREGIADPAKLAIVGWSYGGYAALQSGVVDPALYRAVVAIAPVTDLQSARDEWRDFTNAANVRDYFGTGPHLAQGSPARHAEKIAAPVLLFHGGLDRNVRLSQSRLMRDRLRDAGKPVELIEFPELDHQLEDSAARARMLHRSDSFLREALDLE